MAYDELFGHH